MAAWSASITGNDTAQDLLQEYSVAFWKFEVPEALRLLDEYVRQDFDESDPEEWVNYVYSLANFMWKKGILTDEVREKTVAMIDSGFGLDIWEESGEKTLQERKKVLAAFRARLLSPQPPKKENQAQHPHRAHLQRRGHDRRRITNGRKALHRRKNESHGTRRLSCP